MKTGKNDLDKLWVNDSGHNEGTMNGSRGMVFKCVHTNRRH